MKEINETHTSPSNAINMSLVDRWSSIVGGALLATRGLRDPSSGKMKLLLSAEMIRRGLSGHCYAYQALGVRSASPPANSSLGVPYELGVHARASVTIGRSRSLIYGFWRDFSNLPRVFEHLRAVHVYSGTRSHWIATGPGNAKVEWDAEIHNDIENELIAWRSLPGSTVDSAGSVQFKDAPGNRGTEVVVHMKYNPPAGLVGATVAKVFGRDPEAEIEAGLFRLREYFETGEIATVEGQSHGPATSLRRPVVQERTAASNGARLRNEVEVGA